MTSSVTQVRRYFFLLFFAFVFSCLIEVYIASDANHIEYDLLHAQNVTVKMAEDDLQRKQLVRQHHQVELKCNASDISNVSMCGVLFELPLDTDAQHFTSFEGYQDIHFDASANSTNNKYDGRIRITLKSLVNPDVSTDKLGNVKFQTIYVNKNDLHQAKLLDFKVATWWINMFHVPF